MREFNKVLFPISVKLISIITILIVLIIAILTSIISITVGSDVRVKAIEENYQKNQQSALLSESYFNTILAGTILAFDLNLQQNPPQKTLQAFFEQNQNTGVIILGNSRMVNNVFFVKNEIDPAVVDTILALTTIEYSRALAGEPVMVNISQYFGMPSVALFYPLYERNGSMSITFFSVEKLITSFNTGINQTVLLNFLGDILINSDSGAILNKVNILDMEIVKKLLKSSIKSEQSTYSDTKGNAIFGSYYKLNDFSAAVITTIPQKIVFEGVAATTRRNVYIGFILLFLSIIFVWFFSKTISNPVKSLTEAAREIENGSYILYLKPTTRDELGLLTKSFVSMGAGLAEREKLKDTFGRFINKDIAEKAMRGELALGGEAKEVTIFFSDIRSFTAISEKLTPAEVVGFLNEYMTRMVRCIGETHGVVDKFIGDAIMGVWGAPISSGNVADDAYNCVKAAYKMRYVLHDFNKNRGSEKKPFIKIGCGINTGSVIAGQIGSDERMEYTVIGDAVNLASRTEALNKPLGTDILITEYTYALIKDKIIVEEMPPVSVKGKEKPVRMFAVVHVKEMDSLLEGNSIPKTIKDVRSFLGIPEPDIKKVDVNAEETKYKFDAS